MGKFRSKLKGSGKGKRWPKGQSASSNPETTKHRDQARSRFFQQNLGPSNLTSEALRKHDNIQSFTVPKPLPMEAEEDDDFESSVGSVSTCITSKTFASDWSDCTNMSFNRFLNVFDAKSALHKEMLAILAAITEIIKEKGGTESATEYFCALMTTLEEVYNSDDKKDEQITAIVSLLNMGIKTVPEAVLRLQFSDVTAKMLHILRDYVEQNNNTIVKSIFGILGEILRKQELAAWTHDTINQIFMSILNPFCLHSKPRWRKAAQNAVCVIVKSECFNENTNYAADKVAEFCLQTLDTCMGGGEGAVLLSSVQTGQTTILHTLGLMKETIRSFSKTNIKKSCETILKLMTLNYPVVTSCGLQVLHSLFTAPQAVVPAKLNGQLISALYEYQPGAGDVQPTLAWLAVMQQAHVHLADVDLAMCCATLPRFFSTVTQLWLSEKTEIMTAATHTLEMILKDAVAPACSNEENVQKYKSKLEKCFGTIQAGLAYQFHNVWHQVLHLTSVMFEVGGAYCSDMLIDCLKTLSELRDSYKFSYNNELEHAVGAAVRSMGPEIVLNTISLKRDNGDLNLDRSWMLPVLRDNIKGSTLEFFMKGILPLALFCQRRSTQLAEANNGIGAHSSELLYMQLWNLLPCFCNHPTDIKENFKSMAKILGTAISDRKELRLSVMAALRRLIAGAKELENQEDLAEIARFDKNYLPILFNVYTTKPIGSDEEGQRLAALETIKIFMTIAKPELAQTLLTNAIERLNASSQDPEEPFIKESILDLMRALIPYQNEENIKILYEQCIKNLPDIKNNKEQKKAYRLLEEICGSQSETCKEFVKKNRKQIQWILRQSLESSAVSSKGARLRCLNYLIKAQPQLDHDSKLIRNVIPEAVLGCKDINERTRVISFDVLNTIGETLLQHDEMDKFLAMVVAGLAGHTQLVSCTVLGLASILHNFTGSLGQENIRQILDSVSILTKSPTREIVGACLSFFKVYCKSMPSPMVAASLPTIVKSMCEMTEDCKRHFRLKTRDIFDKLIRKYTFEAVSQHIPNSDTVTYKRIRNLRKLNDRKKRLKEKRRDEEDDLDEDEFLVNAKPKSVDEILADSDSDFEDMETDQLKTKSKKQVSTWIKEDSENIVDFIDPTVVSQISATKPGQAPVQSEKKPLKKDRGFKTAADGRLIITADSSDDNDDDDKKPKKLELESDSESSTDGRSVAETLVLSDRKRKRAASVKSGTSTFTQPPTKYKPGGSGIHRVTKASSVAGSEYKSKKAKGDVKKKGKVDPYAYLPLKRSSINKRKRMKASGQFKHIIKAAKSGALKGAKAKKQAKKL